MGFKPILDVIIDVETVDVFAPQWNMDNYTRSIFNVGITAITRTSRETVTSIQVGIEKVWSIPRQYIRDYYRKNFTTADFDKFYNTFKEFAVWFNNHLDILSKEYKIQLWSYNAMFDSGAFFENAQREGGTLHKVCNDWKCIMMLTTHYLATPTTSIQFANWTVEMAYKNFYANGVNKEKLLEFITPVGNIRTTAQHVYRFISQNIDFVEMHKGLEDTQCERDILLWCQGHSGWTKVNADPGVGWRKANYAFIMGREGTSVGHLSSCGDLTWENLARLNEIMDVLKG